MGLPEKVYFGNFEILSTWHDHILSMIATPKDHNKNGGKKAGMSLLCAGGLYFSVD